MAKVNYLKEGQPVINAKRGNTNGAVGVIQSVAPNGFRVEWMLDPEGVPYPRNKTSFFALTALAPKLLDILDPVPDVGRGFAFLYPLDGIDDMAKMVEAHRSSAENEAKAVQTNFYMIGGVHTNIRYDISARGCPEQPPLKKYIDKQQAIDDASEMAAKYNQTYVVLGVAAIVSPKNTPEIRQDIVVTDAAGNNLLESK